MSNFKKENEQNEGEENHNTQPKSKRPVWHTENDHCCHKGSVV